MSGIFGEAYRKEVQDVNDGAVKKDDQGLESNLQTNGRQVTYTDPTFSNPKDALVTGLLRVGGQIAQKAVKNEQLEEFNEGFTQGTEEGLEAAQQAEPGFLNFIGEKTSRLKGFQQRVVEDSISQNYASGVQNMELDVTKLDTKAYAKAKADEMSKIAQNYSDPEVRSNIIKGLSGNVKSLAATHAQRRVVYEKKLRERATIDSVHVAADALETAEASNDQAGILKTADNLLKVLQKPEGMTDDDYSNVMTTSLIGQLKRGRTAALEFMKASGKFDSLVGEDKDAIEHEFNMYKARNDKAFFNRTLQIDKAIQEQSPDLEKLILSTERKYPGMQDLNKIRERDEKRKQEIRAQAIQDASDDNALITGSWEAQSLPMDRRQASYKRSMDDIATDLVRNSRAQQMLVAAQKGTKLAFDPMKENDGSAVYSQEEKDAALRKNPDDVIAMWKKNQLPLGMLSKSMGNISAMLTSPQLTNEQLVGIKEQMDFVNQFRDTDPALFAEHARSDSELADYATYDMFVNEAGIPPRNAIQKMREIKNRPEIQKFTDNHLEMIDRNTDDITDDFVDELGEDFLFFWKSTPVNDGAMQGLMRRSFEQALKLSHGDEVAARAITRKIAMRKSTVIGNKFIPDGAQLKKHANGYNLEAYIRGLNSYDAYQDRLSNKGFPPDIDLLDDERVTILPINGGTQIQFSMAHPETEEPIQTFINMPTSDDHMKPYGLNWLGKKVGDAAVGFIDLPIKVGNKIAESIK